MRGIKLHLQVLLVSSLFILSFVNPIQSQNAEPDQVILVDKNANKKTQALYINLKKVSTQHILFGHQDDLAYGVKWKQWHKKRSDVNDVTGAFPAVFGWDISKLGKSEVNIDSVDFEDMKNWMLEVYKMDGINTVSWHVDNFVTDSSSWNVGEKVVQAILPEGTKHEIYKASLDALADFFKSLKKGFLFKHNIPIVFRPFHEHTGDWFWWGQPHCTPEEYKKLWQFTVQYLRDEKEVDNLLYCYSPDIFRDEEHYLECYPGDDYVDILGFDDYHDVKPENDINELIRRLSIVVKLAEERDKVAAFTETGLENIPFEKWWTDHLLKHIKADSTASKIAWLLVWRNGRINHHYAPYPGHISAPDFIEFCNDPLILMEDNLPKMYKRHSEKSIQNKKKNKPLRHE